GEIGANILESFGNAVGEAVQPVLELFKTDNPAEFEQKLEEELRELEAGEVLSKDQDGAKKAEVKAMLAAKIRAARCLADIDEAIDRMGHLSFWQKLEYKQAARAVMQDLSMMPASEVKATLE